MPWPIESDYFEAIQNPRYSFSDHELKSGHPPLGQNGLPRYGMTGNFASVYQMNCPSRRWAVRCFLREYGDQQSRYLAISHHLRSVRLPCMVDFEYLPEGIRVRGKWYPMLKMEWLDGEPLDVYVGRHLNQPAILTGLIRQWMDFIAALKSAKVAHGDLQHGNILVCNGTMKLIDYDGMFVPALAGQKSHEEGHRNYQHPGRTGADFNASIDNFSSWVIFITLSALTVEPRLWQSLKGGDETLLFRREDFQQPEQSKTLKAFDSSRKPELRALASHFRSLLYMPLARIPALDGTAVSVAPPTARIHPTVGIPEWLEDHVKKPANETLFHPEVEEVKADVPNADWLFGHLVDSVPLLPVLSQLNLFWEQWTLRGLLLFTSADLGLAAAGALSVFWAFFVATAGTTLCLVLLRIRFDNLGIVAEKRHTAIKLDLSKKGAKQSETVIASINAERSSLLACLHRLDEEYKAAPRIHSIELDNLKRQANARLAEIHQRRSDLEHEESDRLQKIENKIIRISSDCAARLNDLKKSEADELARLLADIQHQHVDRALSLASLANAEVTGVGPKMKKRLWAMGIISAYYVDNRVYRVSGIGPAKARALWEWKNAVGQKALLGAPNSVPQSQVGAVNSRYAALKAQALQHSDVERSNAVLERDKVNDEFERSKKQLDVNESAVKVDFETQSNALQQRFANRKAELAATFKKEKTRVDIARKELKTRLANLSRTLFKQRFECHQIEREFDRYRDISFGRYIRQVVSLNQSLAS